MFAKMSLKTKMYASLGLLVGLLILISAVTQVVGTGLRWATLLNVKTKLSSDVNENFQMAVSRAKTYCMTQDDRNRDLALKYLADSKSSLAALRAVAQPSEKDALDRFAAGLASMQQRFNGLFSDPLVKRVAPRGSYAKYLKDTTASFDKAADDYRDELQAQAAANQDNLFAKGVSAKAGVGIALALAGLGLLACVLLGLTIANSALKPVLAVMNALKGLAQGDLSLRLPFEGENETGQMARAYNHTVAGLGMSFGKARVDWSQMVEELQASARLSNMVENMATAALLADPHGVLRYQNKASRAQAQALQGVLPPVPASLGVPAESLFPELAAQRDALVDPAQLPLSLRAAAADQVFQIQAVAIHDGDGKFQGPLLTWSVITEAVRQEAQAKALAAADAAKTQDLRDKVDQMLAVVKQAASGDLTVSVPFEGADALGQMASGLNHLLSRLSQDLAVIHANAQALHASSGRLDASSADVNAAAQRTEEQVLSLGAASQQIDGSVQMVASATEEMNISIKEIANNANQAARMATDGVETAKSTDDTVRKLSESSNEIGKVIKVITAIAQQTNLLALNATVEAARAGEAGKGFAVVAGEVKELAKETARATEDISHKVEAIQSNSQDAARAIAQIADMVKKIADYQSSIASAVEEQSVTSQEISRNIHSAAKGTGEVKDHIQHLSGTAGENAATAESLKASSKELGATARTLLELVGRFTIGRDQLVFKAA